MIASTLPAMKAALITLTALLLAACATSQPVSVVAAGPCPTPGMRASWKASEDLWTRYQFALDHTGDGSRAYGYFAFDEMRRPAIRLILLVRPDGAATLYGGNPSPLELSATDIAPVEAAVMAASFPNLPAAAEDPGAICIGGPIGSPSFEAARDGKRSAAAPNACYQFAAVVDDARAALVALAKAHGGLEDFNAERLMNACTVAVGPNRW